MIANGVGSWINLLLPVLVGLLLLAAVLGGSLLKADQRARIEKVFLRPLGLVLLTGGVAWAGFLMWQDVAHHSSAKQWQVLLVLHLGLFVVLVWVLAALGRRSLAIWQGKVPPADPPPEPKP